MTIDIDENLIGVWFLSVEGGDWLGSISKREGGGTKVTWRFRYYRSALAWDGKDKKSWYGDVSDLPPEKAIEGCG